MAIFLVAWRLCDFARDFFTNSQSSATAAEGTTNWASYDVSLALTPEYQPDVVALSLEISGRGIVWIKDVELLAVNEMRSEK